jgi:hypothetical protein
MEGKKIFGPAPAPIKRYSLSVEGHQLLIRLD